MTSSTPPRSEKGSKWREVALRDEVGMITTSCCLAAIEVVVRPAWPPCLCSSGGLAFRAILGGLTADQMEQKESAFEGSKPRHAWLLRISGRRCSLSRDGRCPRASVLDELEFAATPSPEPDLPLL